MNIVVELGDGDVGGILITSLFPWQPLVGQIRVSFSTWFSTGIVFPLMTADYIRRVRFSGPGGTIVS